MIFFTSVLDDMKSEKEASIFFAARMFPFLSTYLMSLGALSKSHSLSLSIVSYLYEHSSLSEHMVSGATAWSGPEERLKRCRLMAWETA